MTDTDEIVCDFCGELESGPMLMLSRWAVSSGERAVLVHGEGNTWWEPVDDEKEGCDGSLLHWPGCASMWIAAKLTEIEVTT